MKVLSLILCLSFLSYAQEKPNIILIVADDLGYADVSFGAGENPQINTPEIDRIAKEGVALTRFYACPVCSPTRVGIMTGCWPINFGLMKAVIPPWRARGLDPDLITLPKILAENGYKRRAVIGKWHLGHAKKIHTPLQQGFTHFYGHLNGAIDYFTHEREGENDWHRNDQAVFEEGYATGLLAGETVNYITESVQKKEAFFIYLPFNAPHSPFQAPEEELNKISNLQGNKKIYAAMVKSMDKGIGKILNKLEELKIADNTFILFFSDNGGVNSVSAKNHLRDGKFSVYEGGIRVVAAARWPKGGISGGKKIDSKPIGYIDVLPTICAVAGIDISKYSKANFDGKNVLDTLKGNSPGPDRIWFSYIHQSSAKEHFSVIKEPYKLVVKVPYNKGQKGAPAIELYNLKENPAETENISSSHPELVKELQKEIAHFMTKQKNPLPFYSEGKKGFKAPKDWIVTE